MSDVAVSTASIARREVVVTGVGIVSSLGEGIDAHWNALVDGRRNVDTTNYAPYLVHPLAPISFDAQIPKKGDQRQMEAWQRTGTYAAGLALDSAGIKGDKDILARTDMIVAAGGGERDLAVDSSILAADAQHGNEPGFLNERLMSGLRPTLFLAQLSNLLAGNIAIVHGVTGSSRTFMGEEAAGVDAARIALARIASGQSDIALIGGAFNAERKDMLMLYEYGRHNTRGEPTSVWQRDTFPGFALGSVGAFLVIEAADHAVARGATPFAKLSAIVADQSRRESEGAISRSLAALWALLDIDGADLIVTGATGAEPATSEERDFLETLAATPIRATGTAFGHPLEAQFPLALGLTALMLSRGETIPGSDAFETSGHGRPQRAVVIGTGHWRGEGMALLEAMDAEAR